MLLRSQSPPKFHGELEFSCVQIFEPVLNDHSGEEQKEQMQQGHQSRTFLSGSPPARCAIRTGGSLPDPMGVSCSWPVSSRRVVILRADIAFGSATGCSTVWSASINGDTFSISALHLAMKVPYFSNSGHKNEKVTTLTSLSPANGRDQPSSSPGDPSWCSQSSFPTCGP